MTKRMRDGIWSVVTETVPSTPEQEKEVYRYFMVNSYCKIGMSQR